MTAPTGKEYILKDYKDFMALSTEQFERMLPDFLTWKKAHDQLLKGVKLASNLTGLKPEQMVDLPDSFEWIDDGIVGEGTIEVEYVDKIGGDVVATQSYNVKGDQQ
jgi:hypothetical protein